MHRWIQSSSRRSMRIVVALVAFLVGMTAFAQMGGEKSNQTEATRIQQTGADVIVVSNEKLLQNPSDWVTSWSQHLGVELLATYDTSGAAAWSAKDHPTVFITTSGPGYGGFLSKDKFPGIEIVDANTYEMVAYRHYDLGYKEYFEDHGLGVSPDGRWIYLPTGDTQDKGATPGRWLVIDAKTLLVHQVIGTRSVPHHATSYSTPDGQPRVLAYDFNWQAGSNYMRPGSGVYAFDPVHENKVVGGINADVLQANPYLAFPSHDGTLISIGLPPGPIHDKDVRDHVDGLWAFVDAATWQPVDYVVGGYDPIWTAWTYDDSAAYLCDGGSNEVFKYDVKTRKVVAVSPASVIGGYGCHLNWDETQLWEIGKGEATHNRGKNVGLVDAKIMVPMDQFDTGCIRGDHGTVAPTPDRHELWITCNASFEIVVFDMKNKKVTKRIPTPMGTSTHSGAFVTYTPDFSGEVEVDQFGFHGATYKTQLSRLNNVNGHRFLALRQSW